MSDTIRCPQCTTEIEVTEALSAQLRTELQRQFDAEQKTREAVIAKREADVAQAKAKLVQQEQQLARAQAEQEERVSAQLAARLTIEQKRIAQEAEARARQQLALEIDGKEQTLKDQQQQLADARQQLKAARETELTLRNQQRELAEAREQLELTVARRVDEERLKAVEAGQRAAAEQWQLKLAEAEKQKSDLLRQLEEAQRKASQASQQLQGEVLELSLEASLRQQFPNDEITPVPKGIHGGDIVQTVRDGAGNNCGDILWESKRTKNWSDGWLPKLRDDQRAAQAQLAVLATMELPKGCTTFKFIDGVWVTSMPCALSVAAALRAWMIEVAAVKRMQEGRHDKSDQLYGYVTGPQFQHQFQGVMESLFTMRNELEQEKRAMQRVWAKRDKQIERGMEQASRMYGSLEGILGGALPAPPQLELPGLPGPATNGEVPSDLPETDEFALTATARLPKATRSRKLPSAGSVERD